MTVLDNKKNNAVTKISVGRELLEFIRPDYTLGKQDRYIYCFTDQERELPKELKSQMKDIIKLSEDFSRFIDKNIYPDYERFLQDLIAIIKEDTIVPDHEKNRLLRLAGEVELPVFLAELFAFIVDNTDNKNDGGRTRVSRKRLNLLKRANEATDMKELRKLAKTAIKHQDMMTFNICLGKLTTMYAAENLMELFSAKDFKNRSEYEKQFTAHIHSVQNKFFTHYR